jgi:UDP-N-acetylmuramoylalanine--D-glutamate ligase
VRFSDLDRKQIGVWGVGRETQSFLLKLTASMPTATVAVVTTDDPAEVETARRLAPDAIVVAGDAATRELARCDVLVRSPGVSVHRHELRELLDHGVTVTTPTGLWLAEREGGNVVGITATKGKSTTATLVAHLAAGAGRRVHLAGNIGLPALELLDVPQEDVVVLELSSYQIADLECGPETAVAMNVYREHLNWHQTEGRYQADKLRLLALPGVRNCVLNALSPEVMAARRACREATTFGTAESWHVVSEGVAYRSSVRVANHDLPLRGAHNALNVCAALTTLTAMGIDEPDLPAAFLGFTPLRHRLEPIADIDGITWVDDSISTTPESAIAAMRSYTDSEVILIGGGEERQQDYGELGREIAERGGIVIGLPTTGVRLVEAARSAGTPPNRARVVGDLVAAVHLAQSMATRGTAVLLSPAAPSFNAYRNFEARGEHFRDLVSVMAEERDDAS